MVSRGGRALAVSALALLPVAAMPSGGGLPPSTLSVMVEGKWQQWWSSEQAPTRYDEKSAALAPLTKWRVVAPGVEAAELQLAGSGEAWRLRLILARVDVKRVEILPAPRNGIGRRTWTIDSMSADAVLAMNGGQFRTAKQPWGWLVLDGIMRQFPSSAPTAMAMVVDSLGRVELLTSEEVKAARAARRRFRTAFQSYPSALVDHEVAPRLRRAGLGVDVGHRDGRLAVCTLEDGSLIFALTRFDALNGQAPELPFGTTAPEMAAVMGALGCVRALMLDGGISRHFGIRERGELTLRHKGWRSVPMALEIRVR
jgi:hypothetical protein